eukprot:6172151-Pleurochrysis_carterae.AAC.2
MHGYMQRTPHVQRRCRLTVTSVLRTGREISAAHLLSSCGDPAAAAASTLGSGACGGLRASGGLCTCVGVGACGGEGGGIRGGVGSSDASLRYGGDGGERDGGDSNEKEPSRPSKRGKSLSVTGRGAGLRRFFLRRQGEKAQAEKGEPARTFPEPKNGVMSPAQHPNHSVLRRSQASNAILTFDKKAEHWKHSDACDLLQMTKPALGSSPPTGHRAQPKPLRAELHQKLSAARTSLLRRDASAPRRRPCAPCHCHPTARPSASSAGAWAWARASAR